MGSMRPQDGQARRRRFAISINGPNIVGDWRFETVARPFWSSPRLPPDSGMGAPLPPMLSHWYEAVPLARSVTKLQKKRTG
jgi:hypothetical protein